MLRVLAACAAAGTVLSASPVLAGVDPELCPRPEAGSPVPEPLDLRSKGGALRVDLTIANYLAPDGSERYCYRTPDGHEAPTLRVRPGDWVTLRLSNHLTLLKPDEAAPAMHQHGAMAVSRDPCASELMTATSTNLHFHGMTLPPTCHQDEVLKTSIQPGDPPFEYRFRVPMNEPPGLYWYHPHIHGFSAKEVTGGASGAMIVEGLERAIPEVAGLPERVLVMRDPILLHPDAPPSPTEPVVPKPILDPDGDIANNNTGYGTPARDLSVNFVPVPYPDYPPAQIVLRPKERQLWRVLNACALTYLHLTLLYDKQPQNLNVVAMDGEPIDQSAGDAPHLKSVDHLVIPPGSRAEFIVQGPAAGVKGLLITRTVNTGQDGENDPNRPLASVIALNGAPEPRARMPAFSRLLPPPALPWLGSLTPVRTRKFYLSEHRADPADPQSPILFFITLDGQKEKLFDPTALPDIVVHQGDVEDWIIENRSLEVHAFHIHQLHFQLREWYGYEVDEAFLRDTVNVPYFDNHMTAYPRVVLRMDFRDPNTVGTFLFHCHLLDHEDGGMMGTIRVEPAEGR
jgi:FtsP/CotA-like multicopper oxidase with cupredoxin domain